MFKIVLRNILRNKRRSFLTGTSIAAAVMIVIYIWSFISGVMDNMFDNYVRSNTGHVRILRDDYYKREKMLPLERNIQDYIAVERIASLDPAVTLITGRIKFGVLMSYQNKNKPIMGLGIEPEKQEKISRLSTQIVEGRVINSGKEEVNIGRLMAVEMGYKIGDTITILTQTAYGSIAAMNLRVVGIFSSGIQYFDRQIFYMPLDKAQKLLDLEGCVTEIFLLLKEPNKAPMVAARLNDSLKQHGLQRLQSMPWQKQGIVYYFLVIARAVYGLIYIIILILASFTIFNTMFMSVLERTKEIGVMKALGMREKGIVCLVLLEAGLIGFIASTIGAVFGSLIAYYLSVKGIDFTALFSKVGTDMNLPVSSIYRAIFNWNYVFTGFFLGIFFSLLAALPAAYRAARLNPTEALHET